MPLSEMVVRSKLVAPKPQKAIFQRPRLQAILTTSLDYPLTLINAGTGFGKTIALWELSGLYNRSFWYNITEPDRDPTLFLAHLISAFQPASTGLIERLEKGGSEAAVTTLNVLINQLTTDLEEDAVLILDDYHLVSNVTDINHWLEKLVEQRPPRLHIAISSRQIPETAAFIRWRVKGSLLTISQEDLSFTADEIYRLFDEHYHTAISEEHARALFSYTGGWIIALQLIWQRLQTSHSRQLTEILDELPSALTDLFNYLAQEVLMRQPAPVQDFLLSTAILRRMNADCCNYLLGIHDSQEILRLLSEKGLFIATSDQIIYHYQRLFQDFLLDQAEKVVPGIKNLHQKAAEYFTSIKSYEEAIYHRFCAGDLVEAANLIEHIGPGMLEMGRLRSVTKWIEQLNNEQLEVHPSLHLLMGDILRLRANFEDALASYDSAEQIFLSQNDHLGRSQALRSKAQVYLDTIRPIKASSLLEEALLLLEPQEYPAEAAVLLDQLAENKLNLGKPEEAQALHKEAGMLRSDRTPDDIYLEARSMLRTGRLFEGSALLESSDSLVEDPSTQRPQRFHREMSLLLSLFYTMLGNVEKGKHFALQGIEIGRQLDSQFVEAVGWMRIGHAYQLYPQLPWRKSRMQKAQECYEKAIGLVKPFNVVRVQVEPLWGLCRLHGYQGNVGEAKRLARQAIDIARASGDYWFVALLNTTLGTTHTLAGELEPARQALKEAVEGFQQVGDIFGVLTAKTAQVLNLWLNAATDQALEAFGEIAPQIQAHNFSFLLTRPSHLGVQDPQIFLPLLLEAYNQGIERDWLAIILRELGLEEVDYHPGYGLRVRTLGQFEVWRGGVVLNPRDWQREKARQLFQFLLAGKGKWYSREQIYDRLWPHLDPTCADRNLKVALNALNRALEPRREPGKTPFFIARRDNLYGLNPAADIAIDADDFLVLASSQAEEDLLEALSIYKGDYLGETIGESWSNDRREQISEAYLQAALRLADHYYEHQRWDDTIHIAHEILDVDRCSEPAYQLLMRCHAARGNGAGISSVYQRCAAVLRDELDVEPSPATKRLWQQLTK
jgi:ATP/maltotriose-dependent transcriptional regulator MalT/DNA-binding SARP family transcriptional activator